MKNHSVYVLFLAMAAFGAAAPAQANPEEAWFSHCAGPSADPDSPYYHSLPQQWLRYEYFKSALWPADAVPDVIERHVLK